MKNITVIGRRLISVCLVLVASLMFVISPASADTSSNYLHFDESNFEEQVLKSNLPVIVVFGATGFTPVRAFTPIVEKIANDYQGKVIVGEVDIDSSPQLTEQYGVRNIPTTLVFRDGSKTAEKAGLTSREKILEIAGL